MGFDFGFYNAFNGDRKYDAVQVSKIFDGIINDGVYATIGECFAVTAVGGMELAVGTGRAWFAHTWNLVDSRLILEVDSSEVILNRIDAVVLDIDARAANRLNEIKIIKGTPAVDPERPTLISEDTHKQYPLAYVYVAADVTAITQSRITNTVGTSECPFVTGIIETVNTDMMLAQWNTEYAEWKQAHMDDFDAWSSAQMEEYEEWTDEQQTAYETWTANQIAAFTEWLVYEKAEFTQLASELRDIIDGEAAGHLQNEIDALDAVTVKHMTKTEYDALSTAEKLDCTVIARW